MNRIERTADEIIIREHAGYAGYRFPIPRSVDELFGWQRQLASKQWITKDDLVEVAQLAAIAAGYGEGRLR